MIGIIERITRHQWTVVFQPRITDGYYVEAVKGDHTVRGYDKFSLLTATLKVDYQIREIEEHERNQQHS
jgi:hypothetical protein